MRRNDNKKEHRRPVAALASRPVSWVTARRVPHRAGLAISLLALAACALAACSSSAASTSSGGGGATSTGTASGSTSSSGSLSAAAMASLVSAAENGTGTTPAICQGKKWKIGIDIYPPTITFGADVITGAKAIAASTGCVTPIILSDNLDAQTVIANINSFIEQKVNGIALLNAVAAPEQEAIRLAKAAGIPIVTASLQEPGTTYIDVNDLQAGLNEGVTVATAFKAKIASQVPWIIIANYSALSPSAEDRVTGWLQGVKSVFTDIPANHIIQFDSELNPAVTAQKIGPILATIPSDAAVMTLGINDDDSFIAAQAVHKSGRLVAGSGFGGDSGGIKDVCTGYYNTSGWNPGNTMGYMYAALIAMNYGHVFPLDVPQKTEVLTPQTINKYYQGTC